MAWFRRSSLPQEVRDALALVPGERVLAAAQTPDGWLVATTDALWLADRAGPSRLGWESVDTATWDRDAAVLTVVRAAGLGQRTRSWRVRVDGDRDLLLVVKERVRATVLTSRRVSVDGRRGATVVARRPPRGDDVTWAVAVDPGIDPDDVLVRAAVDQAKAELRRDLGL